MKQFKDSEGRDWKIVVNVGTAKKVRDLLNVNLFDLYQTEAARVFSDPILLVNVLYVLCEEQATGRDISDVKFGEGLVGDAIESAATALMQEVADFFPQSRRKILLATLDKSEAMARQMEAEAMAAIEAMDLQTLKKSPTKSQAS